MKSMLIIGLGDFGHHLCHQLVKMKNEVMVIDKNEAAIDDLKDVAHSRLIADCTSRNTLEMVGVSNFDICFCCVDADFKSSLVIVNTLKELGAKRVVSQTDDSTLAKFLLKNGADEIIYPNSDSAVRAAVKYSSEYIFDYIDIGAEYSIYEISPIKEWVDKSILESRIREKYDTYIISINSQDGTKSVMPSPDSVIRATDHLLVLAHEKTVQTFLKKM